jgi:hypothetical protein
MRRLLGILASPKAPGEQAAFLACLLLFAPTIDVRDANVAGHRLTSKYNLHMLDTQLVRRIPGDLDELIAQSNLSLRVS